MFIISFFRTIKYALKDFVRNFWLSLVTVTILVLTLFTINILLVFNYLTEVSIQLVTEKLDVTIFFYPDIEDPDVLAVKEEISALPQTESVEFISREQRIQQFQQQYAESEAVLESIEEVDENPFGSALVIRAKQSSDYDVIIAVLEEERYSQMIEGKDYKNHQEVIRKISGITDKAKRGGEIMTFVFGIIAVLIVFNTIRITIYSRKEEIHIMKSVGAANWFVKFPYLIQSFLYSVLALGIATGSWFLFLKFGDDYITRFFGDDVSLVSYFRTDSAKIFGGEFLGMLFVNTASSLYAIRRYLR